MLRLKEVLFLSLGLIFYGCSCQKAEQVGSHTADEVTAPKPTEEKRGLAPQLDKAEAKIGEERKPDKAAPMQGPKFDLSLVVPSLAGAGFQLPRGKTITWRLSVQNSKDDFIVKYQDGSQIKRLLAQPGIPLLIERRYRARGDNQMRQVFTLKNKRTGEEHKVMSPKFEVVSPIPMNLDFF